MDARTISSPSLGHLFLSLLSSAFPLLMLTGLLALMSAGSAQAGSLTLQWDAVASDPEVTHYEVCYGLLSGHYGSPCIVADARGSATDTQTVSGLTERSTYYFAVRSANHAPGVYSTFSNEVSATIAGLDALTVTPASPTVLKGSTQQFTAIGTYSDGKVQDVTNRVAWTSTSSAIATIGSTGLATAVGAGTTTVRAALDGIIGSATLTVPSVPTATVTSIAVTPASATLQMGSKQQLTATASYSDGKTQDVTTQVAWTSSSSAVGTIDASGQATAIGAGTTTIRASLGGATGTATLTVQVAPLAITTAALPGATSGAAYSASLAASGGTRPYTWSVSSGSLPAGLALSTTTGVISGTPSFDASYAFTVRVTDSSNPVVSASKGLTITVAPGAPASIWPISATPRYSADSDTYAVELGVKFRSDVNGTITGIRFFKPKKNTGTHVGNLWTSDGTRLATVTFNNETPSGWQQADFSTPVAIAANTVYVASYHAPKGAYGYDQDYFANRGVDNPPLHALAAGAVGGNGVYKYGNGGFPNETFKSSNYWVDVVFVPGSPPSLTSIALTPGETTVEAGTTRQFTATGSYADGTTRNITDQVLWRTVDASVATVSPTGVATAVGVGSTTVSATLGSVTGNATLRVQAVLVADFVAGPTSGMAPLTVNFTDASSGDIAHRTWDFGDGETSEAGHTAVYTYRTPGTYSVRLTVTSPGGAADEEYKANLIEVGAAAPQADFTAKPSSGPAPLPVAFTDSSSGIIGIRVWDFGDGTSSTGDNPTHVYAVSGSYTATLTVTGPGGSDSKTIGIAVADSVEEPTVEVGELRVDHIWQWVELQHPFRDPVVVANGLSHEGSDPVTVRITDVTPASDDSPGGFWIFLQEWEYLDGSHTEETVSYMVMERGHHVLPDGTHVEAGTTDTSRTNSFGLVTFEEPFAVVPVVFSAATSTNETDAVVTRIRRIGPDDFQLGMDEQEANVAAHLSETIAYIAWEPSAGTVDGVDFEVGRTDDSVTHKPFVIAFATPFADPPMLLVDMQTTDGGDTANLRWQSRTGNSVEVWVDEEQSKGSETNHTTEVVGYAVFETASAE